MVKIEISAAKSAYGEASKRLAEFATQLSRQRQEVALSQARKAAVLIKNMLFNRYMYYASDPTGSFNRLRALMGKAEGGGSNNPALAPIRDDDLGLKAIAKHLKLFNQTDGVMICIDPSAIQPGGMNRPYALLAIWTERPKPFQIRTTLRRLVYAKLLKAGEQGYGATASKHLTDVTLGTLVIEPPRRPVWSQVINDILSSGWLEKNLGVPIVYALKEACDDFNAGRSMRVPMPMGKEI